MAFGRRNKDEKEHTNNARPSTQQKHEDGKKRKQVDAPGGEKGDKNRKPNPNTQAGRAAAAAKKAAKKQGKGR